MKFPYLQYAIQDGPTAYVFRPVIPVDLAGPDGEIDFYALVDTGSDDTLIPRYVADELGLEIDDDRVEEVTGSGFGIEKMQVTAPNRANPDGSVLYQVSSSIRFLSYAAASLVCPPTNDSVPAPAPLLGPKEQEAGAGHFQPATAYKLVPVSEQE